MREPAFWWRPAGTGGRPAVAARPRSTARSRRGAWRSRAARAGMPVICIGNLTWAAPARRRPRSRWREFSTRPAAGRSCSAAAMAARSPGRCGSIRRAIAPPRSATSRCCWRASRRPSWRATASAGADAARAAGADVIVMDDGFQNPSLPRTARSWWSTAAAASATAQVFPAGPLRAPLEAQLRRAACRAGDRRRARRGEAVVAAARRSGLPVFHGRLEPDAAALAALKGKPVLAFAGIGDPEKFFATLARRRDRGRARQCRFPIITATAAPRRAT